MTDPARRRPLVVVVTGSECTGKTTLAQRLANHYDEPWSREFVREYLDGKQSALDASDVDPIAGGQAAGEDAAASRAARLVVRDTDLVSTVVYSRHYYASCPEWVEQAARVRRGDLYLLLRPDVPWVADGLQRNRPGDRAAMHALFRAALEEIGAAVVEVGGDWPERVARALAAVEDARRRADADSLY